MRKLYEFFKVLQFQKRLGAAAAKIRYLAQKATDL